MGDILKNEKGQAIVEFAVMLPIIVLLLATVVDLGRVLASDSELVSAADVAARYVESDQSISEGELSSIVEKNYPQFKGVMVTKEKVTPDYTPNLDYHFYSPTKADWHKETSTTSQRYYVIHLSYSSTWVTPIMSLVGSAMDNNHNGFTLKASAIATIDNTIDVWDE